MGNEHLTPTQALIVALLPVLTVVSMALLIATSPGQEQKPAVTHVTAVAGMPIL